MLRVLFFLCLSMVLHIVTTGFLRVDRFRKMSDHLPEITSRSCDGQIVPVFSLNNAPVQRIMEWSYKSTQSLRRQ